MQHTTISNSRMSMCLSSRTGPTSLGLPGSQGVSICCRMSNISASVLLEHIRSRSCSLAEHHSEWYYFVLLMISDPSQFAVSISSPLELIEILGFHLETMLSKNIVESLWVCWRVLATSLQHKHTSFHGKMLYTHKMWKPILVDIKYQLNYIKVKYCFNGK